MKPEALADLLVEHTKRVLDGPHVKTRFEQLQARIVELEAVNQNLRQGLAEVEAYAQLTIER